jgi:hypothetical protein
VASNLVEDRLAPKFACCNRHKVSSSEVDAGVQRTDPAAGIGFAGAK